MLTIGTKIPSFSTKNQDGEEITQEHFKGSWIVLYFYPKDETPGCTAQACSFRDNAEAIQAIGAKVFGVSKDSEKAHQKFIANHNLSFPLLSDKDHSLAESFGVWVEKSMFGKKYFGMDRSTYIIAPDGTIAAAYASVNPLNHGVMILEKLRELTA